MATVYKLLIIMITTCATVMRCEDCILDVKQYGDKYLQFDLTSFENFKTMNFTNKLNDLYSINIKLCKSNEQEKMCDGIKSKICLINQTKKLETDIGSRIKEVKLDVKNQLFIALEGNKICEQNRKYTTDMTFVCSKSIIKDVIISKPSVDRCKYIIEFTSAMVCPVDDLDIRKVCNNVLIPHSHHKFNLNPLRRLTNNYLVESHNRRFEVNICGRLNDNNLCGGNITTICDVTDDKNPKVYAVGYHKNDKLVYDFISQKLKLIQHERPLKKKGRRIEFIFKCNESIPVEKTKPEFLKEDNYLNKTNNPSVAHFEIATSVVCIPRITSCEIFTSSARFNLKPLHKRVGNRIVPNEKDGGKFHLNVCGYLNQYGEKIPASCSDGKTSVCYEYGPGKGLSVGSTQIGPFYTGKSLLLNYTDGGNCKNSLKWSTVINFICSDESFLVHHSTNSDLCIHVFQWNSREACEIMFERNGQCMVTHPQFSSTIYNISYLKDQSFEINDYEDNGNFLFSICSPLQMPCNGNLDSAACWSFNGIEKNIGLFNEDIVFDNGKIYMSMQGEKCDKNSPNSSSTIQFLCDYSDSRTIDFNKDLKKCTFEFFIYTKHACSPPTKVNCTVNDQSGNTYDLSKLTKFNSNYEVILSQKKKIILNVCHSVINNDMNGNSCQFNSGVCLVDTDHLLTSSWSKNLGDVNKSPSKEGNKIILEMSNGFYNGYIASSVIEFICSDISRKTNSPLLINDEHHIYTFKWYTPFVCSSYRQKMNDVIPTHRVTIDGSIYGIYICPKNNVDSVCNLVESDLNDVSRDRAIIFINNGKNIKKNLNLRSNFRYNSNKICNHKMNKTKQIIFTFICGLEIQILIIKNMECFANVLIIDPDMCDKKHHQAPWWCQNSEEMMKIMSYIKLYGNSTYSLVLECKVNSYDLTPFKGNHIVINEGVKYFINLCTVGKDGTGGQMELNGKNHNMGYQVSSPTNEVRDMVSINFEKGDDCYLEKYPIKYSTKIQFICDLTETEGEPKFIETNNKCLLNFEWRSSLLCHKKTIEFNKSMCAAIFEDYHLNMNNILSTYEFIDNSTNISYKVNFCDEYVMSSNSSNVFGYMNLLYDVNEKQLIASFKNVDDFTNMDIIITCSKFTENLPAPGFLSTMYGITIITHSKDLCCLECINHTNETRISSTTFKTTNSVEYTLYTDFQSSDINIEYLENNDSKELFTTEQIEKSNVYIKSHNANLPQNDIGMQEVKTKVSSASFNYSGLVLIVLVLILMPLIWVYRWMLVKELRKLLYILPVVATRRHRRYS